MAYVSIGDGFKLESVTARQFMLMNYAFWVRFGVDIRVTWATRDSTEQIRLLNKYYRRTTRNTGKRWDGSWWEKRPGKTTTVATPGTSRHERGFALDVRSFEWSYSDAMASWARTNASLYGFKFNVAGEPWHIDRVLTMRITSGRQRALGTADTPTPAQQSGGTGTPKPSGPTIPATPIVEGEDDMLIIHNEDMDKSKGYPGHLLVVHGSRVKHIKSDSDAKFFKTLKKYLVTFDNGNHFTTFVEDGLGVPKGNIPTGGGTYWLDNPRD